MHDNMSDEDLGTCDTQPAPPFDGEGPVPFADAPCDAVDCTRTWSQRVELEDGSVRFACARHAYLYLMSTRERAAK